MWAARFSPAFQLAGCQGTVSFCNGWRIGASLPICAPATASTVRAARSTVPSALLTNQKTIAISALQASHSTMEVESIGTAPTTTSEHSNAVAGTGVAEHARVRESTTAKKEGGSVIRRTEESHRATSLAPTPLEVRARAVLPGRGCPEHQATSAVPQL